MIFKTVWSITNHKIIILVKTYFFFSGSVRMLSFFLVSVGYVYFSFWQFFIFKLHMCDFVTAAQFSLVSLTLMSCLLVLVILLLLHHNTRESRLGKESYISKWFCIFTVHGQLTEFLLGCSKTKHQWKKSVFALELESIGKHHKIWYNLQKHNSSDQMITSFKYNRLAWHIFITWISVVIIL